MISKEVNLENFLLQIFDDDRKEYHCHYEDRAIDQAQYNVHGVVTKVQKPKGQFHQSFVGKLICIRPFANLINESTLNLGYLIQLVGVKVV